MKNKSMLSISQKMTTCAFTADASTGHAFGVFMARIGALRPSGLGVG